MFLDPAQEHVMKNCGILFILAGPGSSKTKVIQDRHSSARSLFLSLSNIYPAKTFTTS